MGTVMSANPTLERAVERLERVIERGQLLLRSDEAAEAAHLSRATIYKLMSEGSLKSIKVGRARRIPVAELQRWIASEIDQQNP